MTYRMTCMDALDALLTADLSTQNNAPAELRVHLQSCDRCQRVAASLRAETQALAFVATAVPLTTASASKWTTRAPQLAALAVAAMLMVTLVSDRQSDRDTRDQPSMPATASASPGKTNAPLVVSDGAAHARPPAVSAVKHKDATTVTPTVTAASQRALTPITNIGDPIAAPSRVEVAPVVAVEIAIDETPAVRAMPAAETTYSKPVLLAQSNPKITVFWVY